MLAIKELSYQDREQSLEYISSLLAELREESDTPAPADRDRILHDWERADKRHRVFAAYRDTALVGVITLSECFAVFAGGNYGIINELYVVPEHRSHGVGQALINHVESIAKQSGWRRIDVTAPLGKKWQRTVDFYLREGFVHTGRKLKKLL